MSCRSKLFIISAISFIFTTQLRTLTDTGILTSLPGPPVPIHQLLSPFTVLHHNILLSPLSPKITDLISATSSRFPETTIQSCWPTDSSPTCTTTGIFLPPKVPRGLMWLAGSGESWEVMEANSTFLCHRAPPSPPESLQEQPVERPLTSLILLRSPVCGIHSGLQLLFLQGIGLTTLKSIGHLCQALLWSVLPDCSILVSHQQSLGGQGHRWE